MSRTNPSLSETKRKEFAIFCRKVRLWMAANPGLHNLDFVAKFGRRVDFALGRMANMGIVEAKREHNQEGGYTTRWYVVPQ